jgi:hypothetical protein
MLSSFADVPHEILDKLKMSRVDMGIDIIIQHENGFFAVQAKWRSNKKKSEKKSLTWNSLSTFYALCARTGPWLKYIVITNCDYVRRQGKKFKMDQTIAKGSFVACKRDAWFKTAGMKTGSTLSSSSTLEKDNLITIVSELTGRDQSFYQSWEIETLHQRTQYFDEFEQYTPTLPVFLTLRERQRLERTSFLDKLYPCINN